MPSETISLEGHLIRARILTNVLDEIGEFEGARYEILDLRIGAGENAASSASLRVTAGSDDDLARLLDRLQQFGANPASDEDTQLVTVDVDGAFPTGFYS